jgi:hypothetical protein
MEALADYYRRLTDEGWTEPSDVQVKDRYSRYSEPVASFLHEQLAPVVSQMMGEMWRASYMLFASYRPGAVLDRHIDREQSALSLTIPVAATEPDRRRIWPLQLVDRKGKTARLRFGIGEGALYWNSELPHWRDRLPEGHSYSAMIMFFVDSGFKGSVL